MALDNLHTKMLSCFFCLANGKSGNLVEQELRIAPHSSALHFGVQSAQFCEQMKPVEVSLMESRKQQVDKPENL